jgi:PAS domain-containing protein
MENTQDGIFCFDPGTLRVREVNPKCAQWLLYSREDLVGGAVGTVWTDADALQRFMDEVKTRKTGVLLESLFRQKNGGVIRCIISPLFVTKDTVLCSVVNVTDTKVVDEEIRQTLEDLERQVRKRTAHLEKINEDLRAEIVERRRLEHTLLSGKFKDDFGRDMEKHS